MIEYKRSICYSGYRVGQSPVHQIYPSYEEVLEDLLILEKNFGYIRMYDVSKHAHTVCKVIRDNKLQLKVVLGVEPRGEISNPNCPWGGLHSEEEIASNKINNYKQLDQAAELVNEYEDIVLAVSVGNENTSDWHHNLMDPSVIRDHVVYLKKLVNVPVTFCEGAHYWNTKCGEVAKEVDFISIHSYPLWQRVGIDRALEMNIEDYENNKKTYPDKQIIFTEFGWATMANEQMDSTQTNEENQDLYLDKVEEWASTHQVPMFIFEAFDEPWKGSNNPIEPEKHWGIYNVDRTPKEWAKKLK